jgi:hypothetical protein
LTLPSLVFPVDEKSEMSLAMALVSVLPMPFTSVHDVRKRLVGSCRAKLPTVIPFKALPGLPIRNRLSAFVER